MARKCSHIPSFPIKKYVYLTARSVGSRHPFPLAKGLADEVQQSSPSGAELNNTCNVFPFLAVFRLGT